MANRKANSKVSKGSQKKSTGSAKPADMRAAIRELRSFGLNASRLHS
jgi:hypothetical protein